MAAGSPTNSPGAQAEDRVSCWSIASNGMPFGTMNPARYTPARSRFGTCSATAEIVIPPAECPTRMTLPSLSDAASFTIATTACVRSSCVTPAMGDRSAANAAGSNGLHLSDVGAIAFTPAPGRSRVNTAKPLPLSIGVTLSHAEWLCQPPWTRTKTALVADIAEPPPSDFTIFTTCWPVLCRDQPGCLPAVERADHRVDVLLTYQGRPEGWKWIATSKDLLKIVSKRAPSRCMISDSRGYRSLSLGQYRPDRRPILV